MSFLMRQVAHCDVCGHEWLTKKVPSHCAKCKSRKWNQGVRFEGGVVVATETAGFGPIVRAELEEEARAECLKAERTVEYEE